MAARKLSGSRSYRVAIPLKCLSFEVSLDEIALPVDPCAEGKTAGPVLLRRDVRPRFSLRCERADSIAVVGAVGKQDCIGLEGIEHGGGGLAVMGLSGRQDKVDRPAFGIDERVDLGREAAAGTSHAAIVSAPFFAVAACW